MKAHTTSRLGFPPRIPAALRILLSLFFLGILAVGQSQAVTHRWYAPSGTGDGSTNSTPLGFTAADFNAFLTDSGETEFVIHFLPSTTNYNVETALVIPNRSDLASLKISILGEGSHPEEVRLINATPPSGTGKFPHTDPIIALNREQAAVGTNAPTTALQLVVENLLLDGNWEAKMEEFGHPALGQNYKNAPLNLNARCGAVRRVIVRNFGAIGYAPFSHWGGAAGVETFPFVVGGHDLGQAPPSGWRRPWVVEDCEIHGFNGALNGYTTQLLAQGRLHTYTPDWIKDDPDHRFILVRNVQIRSEGDGAFLIATGSAGHPYGSGEAGRTTFTDNIVLNNSLGYNADTGKVRYVDIHNSIGLNIWWWANLNGSTYGWIKGYDIYANAVRFGPMVASPNFRSFCWDASRQPYTDTSLILGRWQTNSLFTLAQLGSINDVRIRDNWLTTIPGSAFDETGGGLTNGQFRLVHTIPSQSGASCERDPIFYYDYVNLIVGENTLSEYAHAFHLYGGSLTTPATYSTVTNASPPSELQMERPILQSMIFDPPTSFGRVGRVLPTVVTNTRAYSWKTDASTTVTSYFADPELRGAWELSLGQPTVGATNVGLLTRFERHPSRLAALPTEWGDGKLIWIQATGLITNSQYATADGLGEAYFNLPISSGTHGEIFLTAFHDPRATNGASGSFSPYQVAYTTGVIPVGTVISVKPNGEVAVDRREEGVQTGRFRFFRTGSTASNLTVNFTLPAGFRAATLTTDYTLGAVSPASWSSGSTNTFTFSSGQQYADLVVTPVADETIERELVHLQIVAGANYAVSQVSGSASIYIYDGPEWTLYEVTHSGDPYSGATIGVGLSSDVTSGGAPNPMIAANFLTSRTVLVPPGYWVLGSGYQGGGWFEDLTDPEYVFDVTQLPASSPIATGVSNGEEDAYFSGYKLESSGQTRAIRGYQNSWSYLNPPGTGWLAEKNRALAISPNGTLIAGYATRTQSSPAVDEQQPVFWTNGTFTALFSGSSLDAGKSGEARAVNDSGEFVGFRTLQTASGTNYISRAFRSRANGATVLDTDMLIPPFQTVVTNYGDIPSGALAISAPVSTNSGIAAGWAALFSSIGEWDPLPVVWWSRTNTAGEPTNASFAPIATTEGKINAIRSALELFGEVSESGGANPQAWRWPNGWTQGHGFSDKYVVYGFDTDWVLNEIVDASDAGLLLGNGTKNGSNRAFILVPQVRVD